MGIGHYHHYDVLSIQFLRMFGSMTRHPAVVLAKGNIIGSVVKKSRD